MAKTKYIFNSEASKELKKIAKQLNITESEVLENALAVMKAYADANEEDPSAQLAVKQGNTLQPFNLSL
ncbi:MAG: hypothetical protein AAGA60_32245 [Cyanobacteria bacterium P01_E01_bin.42]